MCLERTPHVPRRKTMKTRLIGFGVALTLMALLSSGTVLTQEPANTAICIVINGISHDAVVSATAAHTLCDQGIATEGFCDSGGGL